SNCFRSDHSRISRMGGILMAVGNDATFLSISGVNVFQFGAAIGLFEAICAVAGRVRVPQKRAKSAANLPASWDSSAVSVKIPIRGNSIGPRSGRVESLLS